MLGSDVDGDGSWPGLGGLEVDGGWVWLEWEG